MEGYRVRRTTSLPQPPGVHDRAHTDQGRGASAPTTGDGRPDDTGCEAATRLRTIRTKQARDAGLGARWQMQDTLLTVAGMWIKTFGRLAQPTGSR
jgi:hypothetical protein